MTSSIKFDFGFKPIVVRRLNTSRPTGVDSVYANGEGHVFAYKLQGKIAVIYASCFQKIKQRYESRNPMGYGAEEVAGVHLILALGKFHLVDAEMALQNAKDVKWLRYYDARKGELMEAAHELGVDEQAETIERIEETARAFADKMVK